MRQLEGWRSVRTWGLGITVVLAGVVGAAGGSCAFETKTNFCAAFGLHCREGQECAAKQAICIDIGGCGNGVLYTGEVCDDGNVVDRAWDDASGAYVPDGCNADCTSDQTCGNGIIEGGEQ